MPLKSIVLLFLALNCQLLFSQDYKMLQKQIAEIDSLTFYNQLAEGETKANDLYKILSEKRDDPSYIKLKLDVMLHLAYIYAHNEQFSRANKISFEIIDLAKVNNLPEHEFKAFLMVALMHEQGDHLVSTKKYLDKAKNLYEKNHLESLYSSYCIRLSSYYRLSKKRDSSYYFASEALRYAQQYNMRRDITDAYLLLGHNSSKYDPPQAEKYYLLTSKDFIKRGKLMDVETMYNNISGSYRTHNNLGKALSFSDSTLQFQKRHKLPLSAYFLSNRYKIYEALDRIDSAYFYHKLYHEASIQDNLLKESAEIKKITEHYESSKKEVIIKNKNQLLLLVLFCLGVIGVASVLLARKNKKISHQNRIIRRQVDDLVKLLDQKQVLLSELQHRVKNNLQHVISILEIQKDSIDHTNIEEMIRGNQNRIHSMALLHKKLSTYENVNQVDLCRYVKDLCDLVKGSYDFVNKEITLNLKCDIETISIEKALPIGLIIVELMSNSIKHGFINRANGTITISIYREKNSQNHIFSYQDDGIGFDFSTPTEKGIGLEIIKGLVDQLYGQVKVNSQAGFDLTISFKE